MLRHALANTSQTTIGLLSNQQGARSATRGAARSLTLAQRMEQGSTPFLERALPGSVLNSRAFSECSNGGKSRVPSITFRHGLCNSSNSMPEAAATNARLGDTKPVSAPQSGRVADLQSSSTLSANTAASEAPTETHLASSGEPPNPMGRQNPVERRVPPVYQTDQDWQAIRQTLGFSTQTPAEITKEETALYYLWISQTARALDDIQTDWTKGRIPFAVWGSGQELVQIAIVAAAGDKLDAMSGYYRDLAAVIASDSLSLQEIMAQLLGDTEPGNEPASGGRMMGHHFGTPLLDEAGNPLDMRNKTKIISRSSCLGSQMPTASGIGAVLKDTGKINLAFIGDSSCAEDNFWGSLNQMVVKRLPTIVMVMDNEVGITVPVDKQVAHGSISKAVRGFEPILENTFPPVNGWDYEAVLSACDRLVRAASEEQRPGLGHFMVPRYNGHSSTGGNKSVSADRLQYEAECDCIDHLAATIEREGWATTEIIDHVKSAASERAKVAASNAWEAYYQPIIELSEQTLSLFNSVVEHPALKGADGDALRETARNIQSRCVMSTPQGLTRYELDLLVRSTLQLIHDSSPNCEEVVKLASFVKSLQEASVERWSSNTYAPSHQNAANAPHVEPVFAETNQTIDTEAHIISAGIATFLSEDPELAVYGQDTGELGGVNTCTLGLKRGPDEKSQRSPALKNYIPEEGFGERVFDTAICENDIIGLTIARALLEKRSIAEIQYADYLSYIDQQLTDEVATWRHRTDGGQAVPMLVRVPGHRLLGMWHSGSPVGSLMKPGIRVLVPRDGVQAVGLYRAALFHGKDPVVAMESLNRMYNKMPVPSNLDEITIPLGHSEVIADTTTGISHDNQCTIVTYGGPSCAMAVQVAEKLQNKGIGVKVVDLQTLSPLDINHVAKDAIRATGKVLFLTEDYPNGSGAMMQTELLQGGPKDQKPFFSIESMARLDARPHKPAYGKDGGAYSKPQVADIEYSVYQLLDEADGGHRAPPGLLSSEDILSKMN